MLEAAPSTLAGVLTTMPGLDLPCPRCGECPGDAVITLRLDLPPDEELHCENCDAVFGLGEVRILLDRWQKLIDWVAVMPSGRGQ